jgi:hypothetical protein
VSALELTGPHVDVRYFTGAVVDAKPQLLVTDPVTAIYVNGALDRIEWEHERADGGRERHVVPASHIVRLYMIEGVE